MRTVRAHWDADKEQRRRKPKERRQSLAPHGGRGGNVADILYIGVSLVFFGLTWLLVKLCEHV